MNTLYLPTSKYVPSFKKEQLGTHLYSVYQLHRVLVNNLTNITTLGHFQLNVYEIF
jgi:hypothetical protein